MTNNGQLKVIRPAITDGKISAYSMVKSLMDSGCDMRGSALVAQLTEAERKELGL